MKHLRIGTRTSKLAVAQATLVKNALQKTNADLDVVLIPIDTAADHTQTPLPHLSEGAFCQELDTALLNGEIDCAVHSFKDRQAETPEGITTAAITSRENPRDIVVFRSDIVDRMQGEHPIMIGVSNERRTVNTLNFLSEALPYLRGDIKTTFVRGSIEQRLRRLEMDCDGVVLAIAGLNRLYGDADVRELLQNRKFMILPLSECPPAPGQGALSVDCRSGDTDMIALLKPLHDEKTAAHVEREKKALSRYDETAGAASISSKHFPDYLLFVKGNGVKSVQWANATRSLQGSFWDGTQRRKESSETAYLPVNPGSLISSAVFIAHSRSVFPSLIDALENKILWTSGVNSWFRLAQQGFWIQGCTEELGQEILNDAIHTLDFLHLPPFAAWQVLTHDQSGNEWTQSQIVPTYTLRNLFDDKAAEAIKQAQHVFWSSASQYETYKDYAANDCHHYCRAGKTADTLKSYNLPSLTIFPNSETWRQCLSKTA